MTARLLTWLRHPVAGNALALYAAQVAVTLLPLVTLPYLARVLRAPELGDVVFVQSFSFVLTLVVEFGFSMTAAREVATQRDSRPRLAETVAGVQGAKLVLCGLCLLIALAAWPLVADFRAAPELLALGLVLGLAQGLTPAWFFSGVERLRLFSAIDVSWRCLSVAAILLLVDGPGDGPLVLLIYALATIASVAVLTAVMYRQVGWRAPSRHGVRGALRRGATLFVGNSAVALYTTANVFVLGLLVPSAQVAFFATAEKTVRALVRVLGAVVGAAYPRVNVLLGAGRTRRANQLALVTLACLAGLASVVAALLVVLAPTVVEVLFGPEFAPAAGLLRTLALTLPVGMAAMALALMWLVPRRLDRPVTRLVIVAGLVNVTLLVSLVPPFGVEAAAWSLVAVETFTLVGYAWIVRTAVDRPQRRAAITRR